MLGRIVAPLAGIALLAAPAVAQPSAQALSVQPAIERAGASGEDGSALEGGSWIAPLLGGLIVIGGVLLAAGVIFDNDDEDPVSA